jgi:hypothetical protein
MEEKDIFDLSVAKEEGKFVEKSLLLESEVVSDILEELKEFPWLGSLIKLGKVGKDYCKQLSLSLKILLLWLGVVMC